MDKLNVFISSTFYDLKDIRNILQKDIEALGHYAITHEGQAIFYDPNEHTHVSCVKAVEKTADVLVLIIGSRFGGQAVSDVYNEIDLEQISKKSNYNDFLKTGKKFSITQCEVLKALEQNIPILTFAEKSVVEKKHVFQLTKKNGKIPNIADISFFSSESDNKNAIYIFEFLNFIAHLNKNNSITEFENVADIINHIKSFLSTYTKGLIQKNKSNIINYNNEDEIELFPLKFPSETVIDYIFSDSNRKRAIQKVESVLKINEKGDGHYFLKAKIKPIDTFTFCPYEIFTDKKGKIIVEEFRVVESPLETVYFGIQKGNHLRLNLLFKVARNDEFTVILKLSAENFLSDLIEKGEALLHRSAIDTGREFDYIKERIEFPENDLFKNLKVKVTKHPDRLMEKILTPKRVDKKLIYEVKFSKKDKSLFKTDTKIEFFLKRKAPSKNDF